MDYQKLNLKELRQIARKQKIPGYTSMNKGQLVAILEHPEILETKQDKKEYFVFDAKQNRWVVTDTDPQAVNIRYPTFSRVFDQKAVVHTSEDRPINISRGYNLEDEIAIADSYLREGARARGQELGDASGGNWLEDAPAENE